LVITGAARFGLPCMSPIWSEHLPARAHHTQRQGPQGRRASCRSSSAAATTAPRRATRNATTSSPQSGCERPTTDASTRSGWRNRTSSIARYKKNDPATGKIRWRGKLVLAEAEPVTHNVKTFRFRAADGGEVPFDYRPGQFLTLHLAPRGAPIKRSYTIASTPTWRDRVEITLKREERGIVSRWLHEALQTGDEVKIEAPAGSFVFTGQEAERVLLIGGGVGITPMMSVVRYLTDTSWPGTTRVVLGFQAARDFIFRDELGALAARNQMSASPLL